ncbi:hypothetical protein C4D60_Mb01t29890 [Musa balbisiana]|uniref:Uncharacterized protein n=1 Tax=Musa balbisiana TaxID=52838 RepID=A0A4V4H7R9_MUSBA|nr:hypothetical protein C4D60_Mb01t29890 [Musa balbisiana]
MDYLVPSSKMLLQIHIEQQHGVPILSNFGFKPIFRIVVFPSSPVSLYTTKPKWASCNAPMKLLSMMLCTSQAQTAIIILENSSKFTCPSPSVSASLIIWRTSSSVIFSPRLIITFLNYMCRKNMANKPLVNT